MTEDPSPSPEARSTLLVLHGYEDEPGRRIDPALLDDDRWTLVEPRGPVELPGGPAWFDSDDDGPVEADVRRSLALVDGLVTEPGSDPDALVVLGGFSQGGAVALAVALSRAPQISTTPGSATLAGVFCINGWIPHVEGIEYAPAALAAAGVPVLVVASVDDEVVAVQQGRSAARYLERAGVDVTYVERPGGHTVDPGALVALVDWLASAVGPT